MTDEEVIRTLKAYGIKANMQPKTPEGRAAMLRDFMARVASRRRK